MPHRPHPRTAHPIVAIASTLGLVVIAASLVVGYIRGEIQQSMNDLRRRHLEATQTIERVYAHFRDHGHWPTNADVERTDLQWLPTEWTYASHPQQEGPVLLVHGPHHMILSYGFAPPQQGTVSNTWTLSLEGDKSTFSADVDYY